MDDQSSGMGAAAHLKQPTREQCGPHLMFPYLVLLQVGFTLPQLLPVARCALTAPFHPYPSPSKYGGILSAALSVGSRPPAVTWHPALWSPDFPPPCAFSLQAAIILADSARSIPELSALCSKELAFFVNNCFIKSVFLHTEIISDNSTGFFHWHFIFK